jgi:membrane protease YdiL (CAAX protease family)
MLPEVAQRVEKFGRYVLWLRHGLVVAMVLGLAVNQSLQFSQIGLRLDGWLRNSLIGIVAALLPLGLQGFFRRLYPLPDIRDKPLAAEPTANWILSQLFSVFAEELWLAFCVVSLIRAGHSTTIAVLLPATVFGALHYQYRAGAIATGVYGALFLWRGSLLPPYLFHFIGNIGAFYWARRGGALARRDGV